MKYYRLIRLYNQGYNMSTTGAKITVVIKYKTMFQKRWVESGKEVKHFTNREDAQKYIDHVVEGFEFIEEEKDENVTGTAYQRGGEGYLIGIGSTEHMKKLI